MAKKTLFKILLTTFFLGFILIGLTLWFYLCGLNILVKSDYIQNQIKDITKTALQMDLEIKNPNLITNLEPGFDFSIDNLTLKKNNLVLVEMKNFNTSISLNKILKKEIRLNKLKADSLIVKADKLIESLPEFSQQEQQAEFDYKLDFYNSDIKLDEFELSYKQQKTIVDVYARDVFLQYDNIYKNAGFNLLATIKKDNITYATVVASTVDEIKLYDDRLEIENLNVLINDSKLKLKARIDKTGLIANAASDKFYLTDVFNLVKSDIVMPDGEAMLAPLVNPKGDVAFSINLKNEELDGFININNTKANLKDLSNIPLTISKGRVEITKDKINLIDLVGFYGKNRKNTIKIYGDIKDYYKTFDSNITIDTLITNEFFKDYLAGLINNTVLYVSKPCGTRIIYKAKNNIMDITWLAKIAKGVNFGVDDEKSALSDYDRAVKGDFQIIGDKIDIKNINYYIAPDIRKGVQLKPIIVIDAKMDFLGNIDEAGFSFGQEMPCEFLNIFAKQKMFKKGTIKGDVHVAFKNKIPYLNADMIIKKTFMPQQRVFIKEARLTTDSDLINFDMKGGFKRIKYDFKGRIKNELQPPFVIKNMALDIDNIDVERFLTSLNNQSTPTTEAVQVSEDEMTDDDYMFDTNLIRIEEADFSLKKGNYKELIFGNIKAKLTLDENGILKIQSNKFDIAEGISTLKLESDLKNLKHYVRLGAKDVNSDLMARVLFNLDKEITGKASGLIELNTDKSMKLNGNIKFLVNDGTIGKIGLVEYVLKIASVFRNPIVMISPATILDIINMPEGRFDKISGELKMKDNVVYSMNIQSSSKTLSALIRGRFDMERHDTSLRIYTRFSSDRKSMFGFLRNLSLNALANKVQMNSRNDANYYASELVDLPQIDVPEERSQVFLTQVEGDVERNNFLSSLKKIK